MTLDWDPSFYCSWSLTSSFSLDFVSFPESSCCFYLSQQGLVMFVPKTQNSKERRQQWRWMVRGDRPRGLAEIGIDKPDLGLSS